MYKIPENMKSRFEFVTLAAKRAEQLQMGALPRVVSDSNKVTVIAQAEVAAGAVVALDLERDKIDVESEEEE